MSQNPSKSSSVDSPPLNESPLMRALDPDEREQFKGMAPSESLFKIVKERNRKREEFNELQKDWPMEEITVRIKEQQKKIQAIGKRIVELKSQIRK